jgi:hypothetical protein
MSEIAHSFDGSAASESPWDLRKLAITMLAGSPLLARCARICAICWTRLSNDAIFAFNSTQDGPTSSLNELIRTTENVRQFLRSFHLITFSQK